MSYQITRRCSNCLVTAIWLKSRRQQLNYWLLLRWTLCFIGLMVPCSAGRQETGAAPLTPYRSGTDAVGSCASTRLSVHTFLPTPVARCLARWNTYRGRLTDLSSRMVSSGMLRRVALVSSSETSVFTRATRRNIPKTPFCIVTAVKTSSLTEEWCLLGRYAVWLL
jgi:hypothetical protein